MLCQCWAALGAVCAPSSTYKRLHGSIKHFVRTANDHLSDRGPLRLPPVPQNENEHFSGGLGFGFALGARQARGLGACAPLSQVARTEGPTTGKAA